MRIIRSTHRETLAKDGAGYRWLWPGVVPITPADVPAITRVVSSKQEQPFHPGSFTRASIQGPNVGPHEIKNYIASVQERPFHPGPFLWNNLYAKKVPNKDFITSSQEQPFHPRGQVKFGNPANVIRALGELNRITSQQEQPYHPVPPKPLIESGFPTESETVWAVIMGGE